MRALHRLVASVDPHARMSHTSGAAIYNIIPDVLSRLSAAESVDSDMFKRVMKHLLSLIEKVRGSCGCRYAESSAQP